MLIWPNSNFIFFCLQISLLVVCFAFSYNLSPDVKKHLKMRFLFRLSLSLSYERIVPWASTILPNLCQELLFLEELEAKKTFSNCICCFSYSFSRISSVKTSFFESWIASTTFFKVKRHSRTPKTLCSG